MEVVVLVLFTVYCYKGSQRSYKNTTYTIHYSQYLYIPKAECIPAFLEDTCSLSQCRNSSNRWHYWIAPRYEYPASHTVLTLHLWLVITKFFMDHLAAYKGGYDEQSWTTHDTYLDLALTPAKPWVSPVISMYFCIKAIISACGVRDTSCDQRLYYSCERGRVNAHNPFVRLWFCRLVFHVHTCLLDLEWRV